VHLDDAVPAASAALTTSATVPDLMIARRWPARRGHATAGLGAGADPVSGSVLRLDVDDQAPDVVVIRMSGVLVGAAARHARAAMVRALAAGPGEVVADLSGVTAADSSGAVLLVAMRRHARRLGSSLRLVGAGTAVRRAVQARGVGFLLADEASGQPVTVGPLPASAR
jgi:anti-anti-sigma factor